METTRRGFLSALGAVAAGAFVEPAAVSRVFLAAKKEEMHTLMAQWPWLSGSMVKQWFLAGGGKASMARQIENEARYWGSNIQRWTP